MSPELKVFARQYLRGLVAMKAPADAVRMLVNSTEVVLYRDGQFQVEMISLRRGCKVPPHSHPHIDTYEIALSGSGHAEVAGRTHSGASIVAIQAGAVHSAAIGDTDTAFLSIQQWHGVAPTFITDDWEGQAWK